MCGVLSVTKINALRLTYGGHGSTIHVLFLQDYKQFWTSFGKNIKLGCIEDSANHKRVAPLLRFNSSKNEEELISLDQYVDSMKADQKAIYYLAADTIKSAKSAPFLEELLKRDYEVRVDYVNRTSHMFCDFVQELLLRIGSPGCL